MMKKRRKFGRVSGAFGKLTLLESGYSERKEKLALAAKTAWAEKSEREKVAQKK